METFNVSTLEPNIFGKWKHCVNSYLLRKTIEGRYLDSILSLTINTIKTKLNIQPVHSSRCPDAIKIYVKFNPYLNGQNKVQFLMGLPATLKRYKHSKKVIEYDQEIPQLQTADNPAAPRGRAAQPPRDTRKTN